MPVAFPLTRWRFEVHHYQGRVLIPVAHERQLHSHELVRWTTRNPRFRTSGFAEKKKSTSAAIPPPPPPRKNTQTSTLQQKKAETTKTNLTKLPLIHLKGKSNHPKNHWTIEGQKNLFFFCWVQRNLQNHQWLEIPWFLGQVFSGEPRHIWGVIIRSLSDFGHLSLGTSGETFPKKALKGHTCDTLDIKTAGISENPKNHPWDLKSLAVFWRSWDHPTKSTGGSHDENSTQVHLWIDNIKFGIDVRGGLLFVLFLQLSCRCWGQFRPVVSKRPLDPKIHVRRCVRVRNGDEIRSKYSMNYQNPYQKKHTHTHQDLVESWRLMISKSPLGTSSCSSFWKVIPKQPSLSHLVTSLDDFDLFQIFWPKQLGSHQC